MQGTLYIAPALGDYTTERNEPISLGIPGIHQDLNASLALQLCRIWLDRQSCCELNRLIIMITLSYAFVQLALSCLLES